MSGMTFDVVFLYEEDFSCIFFDTDRVAQCAGHASSHFRRGHRTCMPAIPASGGGTPSIQGIVLELALIQSRLPAQPDIQFQFFIEPFYQSCYYARWE